MERQFLQELADKHLKDASPRERLSWSNLIAKEAIARRRALLNPANTKNQLALDLVSFAHQIHSKFYSHYLQPAFEEVANTFSLEQELTAGQRENLLEHTRMEAAASKLANAAVLQITPVPLNDLAVLEYASKLLADKEVRTELRESGMGQRELDRTDESIAHTLEVLSNAHVLEPVRMPTSKAHLLLLPIDKVFQAKLRLIVGKEQSEAFTDLLVDLEELLHKKAGLVVNQ